MRLLVTFVGGLGHLAPLLPLARAVREVGHDVAIAGSGGLVPRIEEAGFTAFATSPPPHHDQTAARQGRTPLDGDGRHARPSSSSPTTSPIGAPAGWRLAVPDVIRAFGPDLVLRDETDLGTTIAAELLGVPVATHLVLAAGLLVRPELVAPRLDAVRDDARLPPDPALIRLTSGLVLSDAAPSFRSPGVALVRWRPRTTGRLECRGRPHVRAGRPSTSRSARSSTPRRAISSSASWQASATST